MARKIVGREIEKEKLQQAIESDRSELIAIYGRRRIGKTYLIREYYSKHIIFSFTGLKSGIRADQIENFMLELSSRTNKFGGEQPNSWLKTFDLFKKHLEEIKETRKKKVIFIDEFPWVDTRKSGFLSAFENFWNTYCTTRSDLIVVVCGSAASYMIKKIIRNRGGLHNRITRKIKLKPFKLREVQAFFKQKRINLPEIEVIKIYMALGGIAEYLEHVQKEDSSVTAIDRICFQEGAQLEYEYDEVFKSLFEEGSYHEQIIYSLSKGPKKGMTRNEILSDQNLTSGGQFSKSMGELIESGFVDEYTSYRDTKKTTLYRIFDEFCLFHLKFMVPFKGNSWTHIYTKKAYETWCGFAFELVCYKHIESIKRALKCDQIESKHYSWSNSQAQVDLVIDRHDNTINLCEIKFYNSTFTIDANYAISLRNKEGQFRETLGTRKGLNTTMITTMGIQGKHAKGLIINNMTMDSLFK